MASGILTAGINRPRTLAGQNQDQDEDDLYEMANLFPRTTGLPMTV
jgi:hypothetical protein